MFKHRYICVMSIEKDLQQNKPFKDDYERGMVNLLFTSRFIESKLKQFYKSHGITMKQYNILRILRGAGKPMSTQNIGQRMIDRMSDISRIVDRMLDKNMVLKTVNTEDKRLVDISITKNGIKLLKTIEKHENNQIMGLENLDKTEANTLNKLLDKIRGYNN